MRVSLFACVFVLLLSLGFLYTGRPICAFESFPIVPPGMFGMQYVSDVSERDATANFTLIEGTGSIDLHPRTGRQVEAGIGFGTRLYRFTGETQQGKIALVSRLDRVVLSVAGGGGAVVKVVLGAYEMTDDGNITRKMALEAYSQDRATATTAFAVEKSLDLVWTKDMLYRAGVAVYVAGGSALQLTSANVDFRLSSILFQALQDPWDLQPSPVVSAMPDPVKQNKDIDVQGNDFPSSSNVEVKLAGQSKATVQSRGDGFFKVRIQANVPAGDQPVVATAQTAAQEMATTSLTIEAAPTPTPPASLPPLVIASIAVVVGSTVKATKRARPRQM